MVQNLNRMIVLKWLNCKGVVVETVTRGTSAIVVFSFGLAFGLYKWKNLDVHVLSWQPKLKQSWLNIKDACLNGIW